MELFETTLVLLVVAVVLLQVSGRFGVPYPTMLALAGAAIAASPWAPELEMEPRLALALFIAPPLLDAAYDLPPRELRRNWLPLVSLTFVAVILTTAAVAWLGRAWAGLPIAAAVALGAIVAPPDAAAAVAVLQRFELPRRTMSILKGESLLNDAVALLVFGAAVSAASAEASATGGTIPKLLVAVPGGVLLGLALGKLYLYVAPRLAGTLGGQVLEFVMTFGTWIVAERLHVSAILAVVASAMVLAHYGPSRRSARDRVHSYSVWAAAVFSLNVLAFFLMGLQARHILSRLDGALFWKALGFALLVLAVVILVRFGWVMTYVALVRRFLPTKGPASRLAARPTPRLGLVVSWCGMRGLVTLATAFALPAEFPGRDVIVLSAFMVVLGTLVVQGLTIGPLIRALKIEPDMSLEAEVSTGRTAMIEAAVARLADVPGDVAAAVRAEYEAAEALARDPENPQAVTEHDRLRLHAIHAQREVLAALRHEDRISDDAFHRLEEELDWSELDAAPRDHLQIAET